MSQTGALILRAGVRAGGMYGPWVVILRDVVSGVGVCDGGGGEQNVCRGVEGGRGRAAGRQRRRRTYMAWRDASMAGMFIFNRRPGEPAPKQGCDGHGHDCYCTAIALVTVAGREWPRLWASGDGSGVLVLARFFFESFLEP